MLKVCSESYYFLQDVKQCIKVSYNQCMLKRITQDVTIVLLITTLVFSGYFIYSSFKAMQQISSVELPPLPEREVAAVEEQGGGHGESGGHGEAPAAEHGGGGEHGGGEHGAAEAPAKKSEALALVSFEEIFVNVAADERSYGLGVKLELELFDDASRQQIEKRQPAIKDAIIQTSREQNFHKLNTIAGKLYFKELLAERINEKFGAPLVRNVHFSSFFLQ